MYNACEGQTHKIWNDLWMLNTASGRHSQPTNNARASCTLCVNYRNTKFPLQLVNTYVPSTDTLNPAMTDCSLLTLIDPELTHLYAGAVYFLDCRWHLTAAALQRKRKSRGIWFNYGYLDHWGSDLIRCWSLMWLAAILEQAESI